MRGKVIACAVALGGVSFLAVHGSLERPVRWTPDGLFYQARVLELRGATNEAAFRTAFEGPIAARLRVVHAERSGNPEWVDYNERFFERRIAVPLGAAAIEPVAGERSLLYVSLAGYVVAVLAIFGLLLTRFSLPVAGLAALVTALLPALTDNAPLPQTDMWGLALLATALLAALLTLERSLRWLALWVPAIFVLAFTRDSTWVAILALAWCAWRWRSRTALVLVLTGVAAAVPAALLYPVPLRELLAFAVNGTDPAPGFSWSDIARLYPDALLDKLRSDAGFVRRGQWYSGLYLAGGIALLFVLAHGRAGDRPLLLLRATVFSGILYLLTVPLFSAFRLELVLVPAAAFGFGLAAERLEALARQRLAPRLSGGAVAHDLPGRHP
ncbi:MAG TPA: hypothetical protein VHK22_05195 [Gaiellaceae bacterium]|jgi:hypothetical protein|nr:hypothetical protein [Gaiellaceae bacterium]